MSRSFPITLAALWLLNLPAATQPDSAGQILRDLVRMQQGLHGFSDGIFPSFRYHEMIPYYKPDENIFFSSLIALRIKGLYSVIPQMYQPAADSLLAGVVGASDRFRNKYGRVSYNFWPTRPVSQFPGDPILSKFRTFHIPDDTDDSFLIHYLRESDDSQWNELRKMSLANTPGNKRKWKNAPRALRNLKPHGTWLGDRMPPEVDFCVLSNILYVLAESGKAMNAQDSSSAEFIRVSFENNLTGKKPQQISPQYLNESTCLYHLACLISSEKFTLLDHLKPRLIGRIREKFQKPLFLNEYRLLRNALAYLGESAPEPFLRSGYYPFFYANMASVLPKPFYGAAMLTKLPVMSYECKAWDMFLDLEFILLKSRNAGMP